MNSDQNNSQEKKQGSSNKILLMAGIVLIFIIIIIAVLLLIFLNKDSETDNTVKTDQDTVTEDAQQDDEKVLTATLTWSQSHDENLTSLAVSPDGESIAVGQDLSVMVHNIEDGSTENEYTTEHTADDIDYSKDGSTLGIGQDVYGSLLITVEDGEIVQELDSDYNNNNIIEFSPDGEHVATGNRDGIVWIWDVATGQEVTSFEEDGADWIRSLVYSPDGNLIAATHKDGTVNIWDVEKEEVTYSVTLDGLILEMNNPFVFSPDGEIMAGASNEGMDDIVQFWSTDDASKTKSIQVAKRIRSLAFSPDGSMIVIASEEDTAVYEIETGSKLCTLSQTFQGGGTDSNKAVEFVTDSSIAVARNNGDLELWELVEAE
jgi:WD40 repeat protein